MLMRFWFVSFQVFMNVKDKLLCNNSVSRVGIKGRLNYLSFRSNLRKSGEGIVALYTAPNPFLLNKICLNQLRKFGISSSLKDEGSHGQGKYLGKLIREKSGKFIFGHGNLRI